LNLSPTNTLNKYFVSAHATKGIYIYIYISITTFHINLRNCGPFDDKVGHRFRSGTGKVVGFFGRAGPVLDKLGVWIIPDGQDDSDASYLVEQ
jgi:hypothetical protein